MKINLFKVGIASAVPAFFFLSDRILRLTKYREIPEKAFHETYRLTEEEIGLLRNGDIILRRGHGFVSSVINELFHTGYNLSHCALLYNDKGKWKVIHSVSSELSETDGVQSETLEKFVRESVPGSLIVVRLSQPNLDPEEPIKFAKQYLERRIPFDNRFDLKDTSKIYCTELIYLAYLRAFGKDLFAKRLTSDHPEFLSLSAFLDSTLFQVVINHQINTGR
ncbi:MAG: YiiX/YebB-like N1pC/P60 family cysteine hydrolase [Flavobacteriales bacterium]|nr:YiiX/YebB-like N1pC/P60 family cysteine hydrolase [Flavobacteriales bacterium]MCX7768416.1 YiiX/YebB-like N1pC/P60 family cysteine hydrolase [Flavobacteriales bacterium]MDW8409691.1 YiiX/YebB-like N1pC/P60 family cysteine hydrolase [Flavobacteriales bacterium]